MNLALTDDQRMIRDAAAGFLADASAPAAVRSAMESRSGCDAKLWAGIGELGWCGVAIPESFGGMGLGPTEVVLILEQMGRYLACAPYFSTVALAANLLAQAGTPAAKKKYLPSLASGALRATAVFDASVKVSKGRLSGRVPAVVDAAGAQVLLFVIQGAAYAVAAEARGLRLEPLETWDGTRRLADVTLANVAAERVASGKGIAQAEALARLYLAAEQLGGAQQCLDLVVRYIGERKQFGRAIGSFQAVKHRCAQMMVQVEGLRSLAYGAAASQDPLECDAAKALAAEAFFHCAGEAIQLHGGVGFTWEFEPQLHFKRAQASSHWLGTPEALRERIAQALI